MCTSSSASGAMRRGSPSERCGQGPGRVALWRARFVMFHVIAQVELALDARARREPVDGEATMARLRGEVAAAHGAAAAHGVAVESADSAAHLAHAAATVTRLGDPDPDAWADAADRWERLGRPVLDGHGPTARGRSGRRVRRDGPSGRRLAPCPPARASASAPSPSWPRSRPCRDGPDSAWMPRSRQSWTGQTIDHLGLTPREAEVLALVAAGQTNRQIGERLYVSEKTASVHVSNILRKLGVSSRVDAAAIAQRLGVT